MFPIVLIYIYARQTDNNVIRESQGGRVETTNIVLSLVYGACMGLTVIAGIDHGHICEIYFQKNRGLLCRFDLIPSDRIE